MFSEPGTRESRADRPVYTCVGSGCDGGASGIDLANAGSDYIFQTDNTKSDAAMLALEILHRSANW